MHDKTQDRILNITLIHEWHDTGIQTWNKIQTQILHNTGKRTHDTIQDIDDITQDYTHDSTREDINYTAQQCTHDIAQEYVKQHGSIYITEQT